MQIFSHIPYPVFDTHFHAMHLPKRGLKIDEILIDVFRNGLVGAVEVAVDVTQFDARLEWVKRFPQLRLSAGIHPSSVKKNWPEQFQILEKQAKHPYVVAVGETGLDFYREESDPYIQKEAFYAQLELGYLLDKAVIIHNREADDAVLDLLGSSKCRRGIMHCFSSNWDTAKKILDLDFYISFAGNITYKKSENIRDVARRMPADRILVETDAPYLSPQSVRGHPNHPGHIGYTLEALASIRNEDLEQVSQKTVANARKVYGLEP